MKKLNNKGFAISTIIYGGLILFILIASVLIVTLNYRYKLLTATADIVEAKKDKYYINISKIIQDGESYKVTISGVYVIKENKEDSPKSCKFYIEQGKDIILSTDDNNVTLLTINNQNECSDLNFEDGLIIESVYTKEKITSDQSDANAPDLSTGLIPVVYDETSKKWFIADTSKEWYNYDKQNWANAVSVTDSSRSDYFNDNGSYKSGTEIPIENILAMFVWIPRYSYTIGCTTVDGVPNSCLGYKIDGASDLKVDGFSSENGNQPIPGAIDIKFVKINEKDNLSGCTPTYNYDSDQNRNPSNWYTHPAFTFGDQELSGIWVGKFETSLSGDGSANCYQKDCSNLSLSSSDYFPKIVPNTWALSGQKIKNQFETAKFFEHSMYNINGDAHMMKNSEWGAVAYLSQSIYGKYGNENYEKEKKVIYKNDSVTNYYSKDNYPDKIKYDISKSGRSFGDRPISDKKAFNGTYEYNGVKVGESATNFLAGTGASTTGTIYGIYDMAGGTWEIVMGNYNNNDFTDFEEGWFNLIENKKYFDSYTGNINNCGEYSYPGHAYGETKAWNYAISNVVTTNNPWFIRGGHAGYPTGANIFTYGRIHNNSISVGNSYDKLDDKSQFFTFRVTLVNK